ncbi:MAG: MYXO-CTERM sorting domain-containing protein [Deltaproteobacteria bacterium]|nr:MYXO-CTERM sorting domain-containing protein [Deltaproteobacteria bacterium]
MRGRAIAAALGAALSVGAEALAQCSGGSACPPCTSCRQAPASGMNPSVGEMSTLFDRVAAGPNVYGSLGWDFGSAARREFHSGGGWCGRAGRRDSVPVHFPCVLLKAIYLTESSWRQFCTTGQTVISFDCGYGIAQVTSGMRRGETSAYDPARVASSAAYNVSVGAAILADKWRATPCVGDNDPDIIEDWYFATWGYNGLSFRNNPNNPMFRADRPEFRTPGVSGAQTRGNYPYQELVWGYARYPLSAEHYTGQALAYPLRSEICATCGSPTMGISEPRGAHRTTCPSGAPPPVDAGPPDTGRVDSAVRDTAVADTRVADTAPPPDTGMPEDTAPPEDTATAQDTAVAQDTATAQDTGAASDALDEGDASGPPPLVTEPVQTGCGCRVGGTSGLQGGALGGLVLGLLVARRRRREG